MFFAWSSPLSPLDQLRDEMNHLFDWRLFGRRVVPGWIERRMRFPRVNLTETTEALTVMCELPGVPKEAIDISVEGGVLTVRGERKLADVSESGTVHRRERVSGPFERVLELPAKVDVENVRAKLIDGVLEIVLPKSPESKPKHIEVKLS